MYNSPTSDIMPILYGEKERKKRKTKQNKEVLS